MRRCHFCGERLRADGQATDVHHLISRRYFKAFPGEDPHIGNTTRVHTLCHRRFTHEHDDPRLTLEAFAAYMDRIDYGRNIYAQPAVMAAD